MYGGKTCQGTCGIGRCGVVWRDWWRVEGGVTLVSLQSVIAEDLAQAFISSLCCYDL